MNSHSSSRSRWRPSGAWHLGWALALAGAIFGESSRSRIATPGNLPNADKLAHFFVFGLLAILVLRTFFDGRHRVRTALLAALLVSLYGVMDEFHQSFTPGRSVDVLDWVADTGGALLAALSYACWTRFRLLLETPLARRRRPAVMSAELSRS